MLEGEDKNSAAEIVMKAAWDTTNAVIAAFKPGVKNFDITKLIQEEAKKFNCVPIEGMLSHELKKDVFEGDKKIIQNPAEGQKKNFKKCVLEQGEVYILDILISSGSGKARPSPMRTTIFKRIPDTSYALKLQTSRKTLSEIGPKFHHLPFNLRYMADEKKARMGMSECSKHGLVTAFEVLEEKEGLCVAGTIYIRFISLRRKLCRTICIHSHSHG